MVGGGWRLAAGGWWSLGAVPKGGGPYRKQNISGFLRTPLPSTPSRTRPVTTACGPSSACTLPASRQRLGPAPEPEPRFTCTSICRATNGSPAPNPSIAHWGCRRCCIGVTGAGGNWLVRRGGGGSSPFPAAALTPGRHVAGAGKAAPATSPCAVWVARIPSKSVCHSGLCSKFHFQSVPQCLNARCPNGACYPLNPHSLHLMAPHIAGARSVAVLARPNRSLERPRRQRHLCKGALTGPSGCHPPGGGGG